MNKENKYYRVNSFYNLYIKRLLDIVIALIGLILGLVPLLIFIIWIKLDSKGSAFFVQERVGRGNKVFNLYKLRSMDYIVFDKNGNRRKDKDRLTKPGKIARSLSIDEIPQFINILKGDMSLIGPRPLLVRYFPYYTKEELNRHLVRPGLSGLAQVKGRAFMHWDERFKLDLEYVENVSFKMDFEIVLETIKKVVTKEGTSSEKKPKNLLSLDLSREVQNDEKLIRS